MSDAPLLLPLLLGAGLPAAVSVVLISDFTNFGHHLYSFLGAGLLNSTNVPVVATLVGIGAALFALGYLLDIHKVETAFAQVYGLLAVGVSIIGFMGLTHEAPSIPVMVGVTCTIIPVVLLRQHVLTDYSTKDFSFATGQVYALLAFVTAVLWILWAFTPFLGGRWSWFEEEERFTELGFRGLTAFVLWSSPLIQAVLYFTIALFTMMRSKLHLPMQATALADARAITFIHGELKTAIATLLIVGLCAWLAAMLTAHDMGLSKTIVRLNVFMFVGVGAYVFCSIGVERIKAAAESNQLVRNSLEMWQSDWIKAFFLLLCWPFVSLILCVESVHQCVRRLTGKVTEECTNDWLTVEGNAVFEQIHSRNRFSVFSKAIVWGIGFFVIQVGMNQCLTVFLAWLNESTATWSIVSVLLLLLAVGLALFMFPPIPGVPIYLVTGIIISQRFATTTSGLLFGCIVATAFSFVLKMGACTLQQKAIGEQCSESAPVKKFIGVHTPAMKAMRHILSKPGIHLDKVAVLVGGPDWPVSVVAGIMRFPLHEMLLGTLPVLLIIVPLVFGSAFATRGQKEERPALAQFYNYVAGISALASSLVMLSFLSAAGYFVHQTLEEHREDIEGGDWERDPQEAEVLALVAEDEKRAEVLAQRLTWEQVPLWLQGLLVGGLVASTTMVYLVLLPLEPPPFMPFRLADRVSDLPHGNPLSLISPTGACIVYLFFGACLVGMIAQVWQSARADFSGEDEPLLNDKGKLAQAAKSAC